jgi:hypothetical protein
MANQYEEDEYEDDVNDGAPTGEIPADLRKALKRLQKENKELKESNATTQSELRSRSVKDVLESKGVPSKVAKFIPSDVSTSDQIEAWLTENADVFGFSADPGISDETKNENTVKFQRINNATETAVQSTKDTDLLAKVSNPNLTKDELDSLRGEGQTTGRRKF